MWHLTKQQQGIVERRMGSLVGIPNWIPPANTDIFKHTGRLKSVDWQRLTKGPGAYVFEGMLPPAQQTALEAMLESLATSVRLPLQVVLSLVVASLQVVMPQGAFTTSVIAWRPGPLRVSPALGVDLTTPLASTHV